MAPRMSAEPKGQKQGVRIVLVALVLLLAALPAAAQAKSFRGKTFQDRMASVVVGDDGFVSRIGSPTARPAPIRATASRTCSGSSRRSTSPRPTARPRSWCCATLDGGGRSRQSVTVTAKRTVAEDGTESWSGTFKTRAVLIKDGERLDVCELKRVTWSAEEVSLPVTSS